MSGKSRFGIKRPEKIQALCLDASLQADWEAAEAALVQARKAPQGDRMTGNAEATRLADEVQAIEAAMLAETIHFRLRGLPRSKWAELLAANPPGDSPEDRQFGADKAAFFDAAIAASIVEVKRGDVVEEFDPEADWEPLADDMTDRQYSDFADAVFMLNRGAVSVPFSRAASQVNRRSSETSEPHETTA